jgi:hypothetical protein
MPEKTSEDPASTENEVVDAPDSTNEPQARDAEASDDGAEDGAADAVERDDEPTSEALLPADDAQRFRDRWESVQAGFVDKPQETVEEADDLVRDLVQELTAGFVQRREKLEGQWKEGDDASTEDLRVALTHYRSFFNRLLST